ncbi:hypothetical protein [Sphingomonas immobilis]|uniref:Uncharacterized protein n=1 Tax=Sphingomonas immobilis TaxID=3063997 RepID=A0ABT8ZZL5_9SPHN|nr:hypothetical protein [Sphingomonas sp. CA1-15]MDO7843027.1 hypothetical protein [Sphingomonas sp. CA1-15]
MTKTLFALTACAALTFGTAAIAAPKPTPTPKPIAAKPVPVAAKPAPVVAAKPVAKPVPVAAAKPAPKPKPAAAPAGRMVQAKLANGKTVTYNCSLAGNATKKACKS